MWRQFRCSVASWGKVKLVGYKWTLLLFCWVFYLSTSSRNKCLPRLFVGMQPRTAGGASLHNGWIKDVEAEGGCWGWGRQRNRERLKKNGGLGSGQKEGCFPARHWFISPVCPLPPHPPKKYPTPNRCNPIYIQKPKHASEHIHAHAGKPAPPPPCQRGTIKNTHKTVSHK